MRKRMRFIFTRFSSRLPMLGADFFASSFCSGFEGFDSCFVGAGLDSCFGGSGSFLGSGCFGFSVSPDGCDEVFWSSEAASFGSDLAGSSLPPSGAEAPSSMTAISWPTVTVSSSLTLISLITPATGALTATSI